MNYIHCKVQEQNVHFLIILRPKKFLLIIIAIFKDGAQLPMAVFSGALKINNEIKIISHVIISKMLTMGVKKSKT